jgi:signal transduction histidine kinase
MHNRELLLERERLLAEIELWNQELERRVAEKSLALERAHDEILQSEKLAALGHLSAGMAHEIRNPLNSISLFAQVLRAGVGQDQEMLSYTDKIVNEVERIDDILVKLLATSKRSPFQLRSVQIREVLSAVVASFEAQARAQNVEVATEFMGTPPAILADGDELAQIFSNLVANALFEMRSGGRLGISLGHDEHNFTVTISDTGGGVPAENLGKIFDPFFTTKEKGTGFGLSVVLRIVKTYGGSIHVESEPGAGSRFVVSLPLV